MESGDASNAIYKCEHCGGLVWVPRGSNVKKLTTGGLVNPRAFVLRVRGKNIHRCELGDEASP